MKSAKPPAFATWLLEQLALGDNHGALAGDLIEEFERRCSVAWYRRQVVGGMVAGLASELRAEWEEAGLVIAWTFGFAVAWNCAMSSYEGYVASIFVREAMSGAAVSPKLVVAARYPLVSAVAMLAVGIVLYLAILRSLEVRRFARGLSVGVLILGLEELGFRTFLPMRGLNLWRVIAFLWTWFSWLPLFFAVLLAMWTARPSWTRSGRRRSGIVA